MRWPLTLIGMCLAVAACFSPVYPEGSACTESCPGDLTCVDGRCTRGGGDGGGGDGADSDASIDALVCPANYVLNDRTGSSYRVVGATASQAAAVADCADDGAGTYLAIPDDLNESNTLDMLANNDAWIGITDAAMEDTWLTVRGTAQTYFKWDQGLPKQPDGGALENCAFVRDGAWADVDCALLKPFICECR